MSKSIVLLLLLYFSLTFAQNHGTVPVGYGNCPLPTSWTCSPYAYNSGDKCDCNCGIYDPDCDLEGKLVFGCDVDQYCGYDAQCHDCSNQISSRGTYLGLTGSSYGICQVRCSSPFAGTSCDFPSEATSDWTCNSTLYNDGVYCNCGCEFYDPDCDKAGIEIVGCSLGEFCGLDGNCMLSNNQVNSETGTYVSSPSGNGITTGIFGLVLTNCTNGEYGLYCNDSCYFDVCQVSTYDQMSQCLLSLEVDDSHLYQTIDAIKKYLVMYAFIDQIREPPYSRDLFQDLDNLRSQIPSLSSDEFQNKLANLFNTLNDAHTIYTKPLTYRNLYFVQPITTMSFVKSNGEQGIFVDQVIDKSLSGLKGLEISMIDGVNAVNAMIEFANNSIGISKDLGTRYNLAVDAYWSQKNLVLYGIPSSPNITYTFVDPNNNSQIGTFSLPWLSITAKKVNSREMLMGSYLRPIFNQIPKKSERSDPLHVVDLLKSEHLDITKLSLKIDPRSFFSPEILRISKKLYDQRSNTEEPLPVTVLFSGTDISLFSIGNNVGILKITTFNPLSLDQFKHDVAWSLLLAQDYNMSNLILDLRDNGGGYICLGYALSRYLWPELTVEGAYDIISSPFLEDLALAAAANQNVSTTFTPTHWVNYLTNENYQNASWLIPGITKIRGGVSNNYSQLIHSDCQYEFISWPLPRHLNYSPFTVLLLSHGYCGSTCAVFTRSIQEFGKAKSLVLGGIKGRPQQISSFPGGQIYYFDSILQRIADYNLTSPNNPPYFDTTCRFSWTLREIYPWKGQTTTPMEFIFEPADFHMDYSQLNVRNDTWLYSDAAKYFYSCNYATDTKPCIVPNGSGVYHCDITKGTFESTCSVTSCIPGYQLDTSTFSCVPCSSGFYKSDSSLSLCTSCANAPENTEYIGPEGSTSIQGCVFACKAGYSQQDKRCEKSYLSHHLAASVAAGFFSGSILLLVVAFVILKVMEKKGLLVWNKNRYAQLD